MTISEVIEECKKALAIADRNDERYIDLLITIIKALEQEPCDNAISRQAVLEQINCWIGSGEYRYTNATDYLTRRMQGIPPVKPQYTEAEIQKMQELEQAEIQKAYELGKAEQPCGKDINVPATDAISRQAVDILVDELARAISDERCCMSRGRSTATIMQDILELPPVTPQPKIGHCKGCKHFEYDSVANVDGVPLIVAHEICSRWGDGCKTSEDGYCFLFEPKMQEVKE